MGTSVATDNPALSRAKHRYGQTRQTVAFVVAQAAAPPSVDRDEQRVYLRPVDLTGIFAAYSFWLFTFVAGGVTLMGLAQIVTSRMVFGFGYSDWSARESRQFGSICVVLGMTQGLYALYGGLSLVWKLLPVVGIGHWWGIFIPDIPAVVFIVGASALGAMVGTHRKRAASKLPRG